MMAHSIGGYITNHYLMKYQPNVNGVFMLSPAGTLSINEDEGNINYEYNIIKKITNGILGYLVHNSIGPHSLYFQ